MAISDFYVNIDYLTFYGIRGNYIDVIMYYGNFNRLTIKEAMDIAVKEKFTIEFPCPIISYGIRWKGNEYQGRGIRKNGIN